VESLGNGVWRVGGGQRAWVLKRVDFEGVQVLPLAADPETS
jgi:hypothetical protein